MNRPTKTLNPLHFEDLEPHRFEDLVRQLIYDFRQWRSIEPTGRLGADQGVDIRATEAVTQRDGDLPDEDEEPLPPTVAERLWVIQCKREKRVTPKEIPAIVSAAIPPGHEVPYGFILTAACDFSRKTRDVFRSEMVARKISEYFLWGKADLEDMLYRPEHDHLLFAYFGISLVTRRRTLKSRIRSILAIKRRAITALGDVQRDHYDRVLIRDAADTNYPYKQEIPDFDEHPRWYQRLFVRYHPNGLLILKSRYFAYVADDYEHWDYVESFDDAVAPGLPDPWTSEELYHRRNEERNRIFRYWLTVSEKNRGMLIVERLIRYEDIVDIDKDGDRLLPNVSHIFAEFKGADGPYSPMEWASIDLDKKVRREPFSPEAGKRIRFFPHPIPDVPD